jgi:putative FmdB family regulatory protein
MPTYEYRCRECGEPLEVVQAFSDDPLTECPACGGPLRKVFNSVGISFKGSGFYKTDSRSSSSSSSSSSSDGGSSSSETSSSEASSSTSSSSPSSGDSSSSKTPASTT